ncbi:MAG: type II toxin-antitoxin system death-on-curing family toxin [Eubacteriales bacterium]|nr:type II toxin-antitoxin system death-on-curing family toxin [Eubacteriales bacterium]
MIRITEDMAKLLHQLIAQETGGSIGIRDEGLLNSALESAFVTFGGQELYPTKEEKAARIGFSLISNHAFIDGNKRIGMHIMITFLELNGIRLNITDEDVIRIGLGVADGSVGYDELLRWIRKNS